MTPVKKINTVFLIDDDNITNFINARLIRKIDVSDDLMISLNGREAIDCLQERLDKGEDSPDLIFLDINMPVMDGFDFVENFSRMNFPNQGKVVIYMLTTSENVKDIERVKKYDKVAGYLNKPLTEDKVKRIVKTHFPS